MVDICLSFRHPFTARWDVDVLLQLNFHGAYGGTLHIPLKPVASNPYATACLQSAVEVLEKITAQDAIITNGCNKCVPLEMVIADDDVHGGDTLDRNKFVVCRLQFYTTSWGFEFRALLSWYIAEKR